MYIYIYIYMFLFLSDLQIFLNKLFGAKKYYTEVFLVSFLLVKIMILTRAPISSISLLMTSYDVLSF